jgi:two-component system chemotaxis response regulator CheY
MRILVVEDELAQSEFLRTLLTLAGHETVLASDGVEGWQVLQRDHQLRLVVSDWMMPGMDGLELVRRVRAANWPHYTYLVLLTSKTTKRNVLTGLEAGADDYLMKPFDPEELLARVKIGERLLNLEARLQRLAAHDSLTGLLNRRALYDAASLELERAARTRSPISLILLDVDHFKNVNDQYGHLVGDEVLRLLARTLQHQKRSYDQVGRWGGEEFLVLLPQTTPADGAVVAERLRASIAAAHLTLPGGQTVPIRASFGVTSTTAPVVALDVLLQQADQALYRAKALGRNLVCTYDSGVHAPAVETAFNR